MLVFGERGKPEYPGKNLSQQSREPTNSTNIWRPIRESNPGHIGGRPVLSPLRLIITNNHIIINYYIIIINYHIIIILIITNNNIIVELGFCQIE